MNARIIGHFDFTGIWYEVQFKRFLFWHSIVDVNNHIFRHNTIEEAIEIGQRIIKKR